MTVIFFDLDSLFCNIRKIDFRFDFAYNVAYVILSVNCNNESIDTPFTKIGVVTKIGATVNIRKYKHTDC